MLKNFLFSVTFLLFSILLFSFKYHNFSSPSKIGHLENLKQGKPLTIEAGPEKIKFVLRWHGILNPTGPACDCPGCVCSFCPCPLGICGCKKAIAYSESSIELGDDVGTADAWIENSKIYLKFDQQTAVNITALGPDDVVPISIDLEFSSYLCSLLGKTSIILPEGNYVVDYSGTNNTYGTIEIPAIMN